jgi:16S rRNA (guanine527-N7)-methyltransferase
MVIDKPNQKILDIGCGAGFPSVPLAISNRNLNITAVDSVKKKTDFVESVKNELNLDNLSVYHARIEDFARLDEHREQYDIVVSRAVAPLNIILEYSAPMLKNGGFIYAYKGINYNEEVKSANRALRLLDCDIVDTKTYHIDELDTDRYVIIIKKNSKIISKYPRKKNKPRLSPL